MLGILALLTAAMFAGAALYVSVAEHPARIRLDNHAALVEWQISWSRAAVMQIALALIAGVLGLIDGWVSGDPRWYIGAAAILATLPYTFLVVWGTNRRLVATPPECASPESRELLMRWARLHSVRTLLGLAGALVFAWVLRG